MRQGTEGAAGYGSRVRKAGYGRTCWAGDGNQTPQNYRYTQAKINIERKRIKNTSCFRHWCPRASPPNLSARNERRFRSGRLDDKIDRPARSRAHTKRYGKNSPCFDVSGRKTQKTQWFSPLLEQVRQDSEPLINSTGRLM